LAVALTAIQPQTQSPSVAGLMFTLTALAVFLAGAAYRFHDMRYPLVLRVLLVAIALQQGFKAAWASIVLANRYEQPAWLALAALAGLGVVLAVLHVAFYRSPPKPEPDTRTFKWAAVNGPRD
jgi:hypothetical protein